MQQQQHAAAATAAAAAAAASAAAGDIVTRGGHWGARPPSVYIFRGRTISRKKLHQATALHPYDT